MSYSNSFRNPIHASTIRDIEVNVSYRWFFGYDLMEKVPRFSIVSKNYVRRFKEADVFDQIFDRILGEAVDYGFVDASAVSRPMLTRRNTMS